jgi:hypothetical protein
MPVAPVATNLRQALDIKGGFLSKLTLNHVFPVNILPEPVNLILGEVICFGLSINTGILQYFMTQCRTNPMDILQRYPDLLSSWYVYSSDTWHQTTSFTSRILALPLLMAGLGANHPDYPTPPYYLTLIAPDFN